MVLFLVYFLRSIFDCWSKLNLRLKFESSTDSIAKLLVNLQVQMLRNAQLSKYFVFFS